MGLFQIGYRRYEGPRTKQSMRWLPITRTGVAIAGQSKLVTWITRFAFLPFLYLAPFFFLVGRLTDPAGATGPYATLSQGWLPPALRMQLANDPAELRVAIWSGVFAFMGAFQLWMVVVITALVGPILISNDHRSRAFLIYFARPVSRLDYVLGKAGIIISWLARVTLLPSLTLYAISILFSPSLETVMQTLPIVCFIILCSLGTIIPAALIMLSMSSLVRQPKYAAAGWIIMCFFGAMAHPVLQLTHGFEDSRWTFLLSPYDTIRAFQFGLYDVANKARDVGIDQDFAGVIETLTSSDSAGLAAGWLLFVSIACLLFLLRRVEAPTRI